MNITGRRKPTRESSKKGASKLTIERQKKERKKIAHIVFIFFVPRRRVRENQQAFLQSGRAQTARVFSTNAVLQRRLASHETINIKMYKSESSHMCENKMMGAVFLFALFTILILPLCTVQWFIIVSVLRFGRTTIITLNDNRWSLFLNWNYFFICNFLTLVQKRRIHVEFSVYYFGPLDKSPYISGIW